VNDHYFVLHTPEPDRVGFVICSSLPWDADYTVETYCDDMGRNYTVETYCDDIIMFSSY